MRRFIWLVTFAIFSLFVSAQNMIDIHGGVAVPSFEFRNMDTQYGGAAETGFNFGLKYIIPIRSVKGLSYTIGIDYISNELNSKGKSELKNSLNSQLTELYKLDSYTNLNLDYFHYVNIPVLLGTEYKLVIDKTKWLFLTGAIGPNYSKPSDFTVLLSSQGIDAKMIYSFNSKIRLAYQLGIGVLIDNQYSIGINYNALGLYEYKGSTTFEAKGQSETTNGASGLNVNISTYNATVSVRF